jgi:hypothetical protein
MRIPAALLACSFIAAPALAQQPGVPVPAEAAAQAQNPAPSNAAEPRFNQLLIPEGEDCPPSTDEVLTVCVTYRDPYRIPENLRSNPNDPAGQSWTNQAIALAYVGASGIGSCSPAGGGGFTGCQQQLINQYVAERQNRDAVNWARLIEEARQARLGGIDAASREAELTAAGNRRIQELRIRDGQTCPPSTELVLIICTNTAGERSVTQESTEPRFMPPVAGQQPQQPAPAPRN